MYMIKVEAPCIVVNVHCDPLPFDTQSIFETMATYPANVGPLREKQ